MREYEILGQKIVISHPEEAELASYAIEIVDEKLKQIRDQKPTLSREQTAVLALLQIAGDLVKDRRTMDEYRHELDQRCTSLMTEVASILSRKDATQEKTV